MHDGTKVVEDDVSRRIRSLVAGPLQKLASAEEGWITLYLDPRDNRFWELQYPHSEMHGGGPPALICIQRTEATLKYDIYK